MVLTDEKKNIKHTTEEEKGYFIKLKKKMFKYKEILTYQK